MVKSLRVSFFKEDGERGSMLAIAAIGMAVLVLGVGFAVDISHFYLVKTELQNAADAAALAGASALNSGSGGIDEAAIRAVAAMNQFEFNNVAITIDEDEDVTFASELDGSYVNKMDAKTNASAIRFVRVQLDPQTVNIFFVIDVIDFSNPDLVRKTFDISAQATAGMSPPLNYLCQLAPLSVAQCPAPGEPYYEESGGAACALDTTCAAPNATKEYVKGCTYTIKLKGGSKISPGNYLILQPNEPGGSEVREGVASGRAMCKYVNEFVSTEPGAKNGPVRQGINTRFNEYNAGLDPSDYPPDTDVYSNEDFTHDEYISDSRVKVPPDSNTDVAVDGRRVIIVPVVAAGDYANGRDTVQIKKFAAFFLRTKADGGNDAQIVAEYIDARVIAEGGFDPTGASGDPSLTKPVLYR